MRIGYGRTSTVEQTAGLEAQKRDLLADGCEEIFEEQVSSVQRRDELARALKFIRKGDTLVVAKLDRLARSVPYLVKTLSVLDEKKASFRIAMNLDSETSTGRLLVNLVGSIAQFEREIMLERQREGIAKPRADGKYRGRAPTARAKSAEVIAFKNAGVGPVEIARRTGIGRASVYRIINGGT